MDKKITRVPKKHVELLTLRAKKAKVSREAFIRQAIEQKAIAYQVHQKSGETELFLMRLAFFLDRNNREWFQLFALLEPNWESILQEGGVLLDRDTENVDTH
ncbi:hypothetical protein EP56_01795 [Listeriaceae bacterium FSL A5-0209]|nr:hypothetical protein EP56_01795 [Listeriaceae bacterium FSL A5-0209]